MWRWCNIESHLTLINLSIASEDFCCVYIINIIIYLCSVESVKFHRVTLDTSCWLLFTLKYSPHDGMRVRHVFSERWRCVEGWKSFCDPKNLWKSHHCLSHETLCIFILLKIQESTNSIFFLQAKFFGILLWKNSTSSIKWVNIFMNNLTKMSSTIFNEFSNSINSSIASNITFSDNITTSIDEEEFYEFTRAVSISVLCTFSFIFLIGLVGNLLVVTGEREFLCCVISFPSFLNPTSLKHDTINSHSLKNLFNCDNFFLYLLSFVLSRHS